jgi:hypothetical protein
VLYFVAWVHPFCVMDRIYSCAEGARLNNKANGEKSGMWMRKRRDSLVQDLSDTAEELRSLGNRIMELSVDLTQKDLHRAAESTARMVLALQEKEELLRRHVERLTKTGNLGRRVTDHVTERSGRGTHERGAES